jgi:twitching motility protein PilT
MEEYIKQAIEAEASDVFLTAQARPVMRVDGELRNIKKEKLRHKKIKDYFFAELNDQQKEVFYKQKDLDIRHQVAGSSMRVNLHQQADGIGAAIRIFPEKIPTLEQIRLEDPIRDTVEHPHGLVLITGPAGSGKSTTITSLLEKVNQEQAKHIITIEDPVEIDFDNKKSIIEQRNVNIDTPSFHSGLKYVLRQDPDIIFLGEMRDQESVAAALTAAETGHLVFSTLHTPTAADTIERIIDLFPGDKRRQILVQLASTLRMVVSQKLLPAEPEGRVAAREIMINNSAISNLITNNNISQIDSVIQTNRDIGMKTMERAIKKLTENGLVDEDYQVNI